MKIKINEKILNQITFKNRKQEPLFFEWFQNRYGFKMDQIVYDYYLFKLEEEENCTGILNIYGPEALKNQYPRFHHIFYVGE